MSVWEHLRTAWLEIRAHKMRSFLSFFAISIGVASILYTFSQVYGIKKRVAAATELMGPGRMQIEKKRNYVSKGLSPGLTIDDAEALREHVPELYMLYPVHRSWGVRFRYEDFFSKDFIATGVGVEWRKRDWVYELRGRFFSADDEREGRRVCLLIEPGGWEKKPFWARFYQPQKIEKLLKRRDLLGKTVSVGDHLFTVIGILKEPPRDKDPRWIRSGYGGQGTVLVPITTYHRTLARFSRGENSRQIDEIQLDTGEEATVSVVKKKIETLLKARHRGEEDYEITDNRELVQGVMNQVQTYLIAILAVGIVAILSGGIGIMNVTLATIFSRVKEIGIRRAVGATRRDIVLQFVVEAMALGFMGGVAGVLLGIGGITYLASRGERDLEFTVFHVLASLAVAVGTGFFFALYPASQAAKLDPVQALHYE